MNEAVGILTNDSTPMGPVGMGPNLNQSTSAIDDLASLDIGTFRWVGRDSYKSTDMSKKSEDRLRDPVL